MDEDVCAICLSVYENIARLDNCLHAFCYECIIDWNNVNKNRKCPMCMQPNKKIIFNVQWNENYDEYDLITGELTTSPKVAPLSKPVVECDSLESPRDEEQNEVLSNAVSHEFGDEDKKSMVKYLLEKISNPESHGSLQFTEEEIAIITTEIIGKETDTQWEDIPDEEPAIDPLTGEILSVAGPSYASVLSNTEIIHRDIMELTLDLAGPSDILQQLDGSSSISNDLDKITNDIHVLYVESNEAGPSNGFILSPEKIGPSLCETEASSTNIETDLTDSITIVANAEEPIPEDDIFVVCESGNASTEDFIAGTSCDNNVQDLIDLTEQTDSEVEGDNIVNVDNETPSMSTCDNIQSDRCRETDSTTFSKEKIPESSPITEDHDSDQEDIEESFSIINSEEINQSAQNECVDSSEEIQILSNDNSESDVFHTVNNSLNDEIPTCSGNLDDGIIQEEEIEELLNVTNENCNIANTIENEPKDCNLISDRVVVLEVPDLESNQDESANCQSRDILDEESSWVNAEDESFSYSESSESDEDEQFDEHDDSDDSDDPQEAAAENTVVDERVPNASENYTFSEDEAAAISQYLKQKISEQPKDIPLFLTDEEINIVAGWL